MPAATIRVSPCPSVDNQTGGSSGPGSRPKALAAQDPNNTDWRRDLSVSYERVGDVCEAAGDLAEAVRLYALSEPIAAGLAALAPTRAGFQSDLRITRARLAALRAKVG